MSTIPTVTSWTSADIDTRLKDSAKLLQEWSKLLDKAGMYKSNGFRLKFNPYIIVYYVFIFGVEKVSNPKDVPKSDVEQHIKLVSTLLHIDYR